VRASLGCYNNEADIDTLAEMLERIVRKEFKGTYVQDNATGTYRAEGFAPDFERYFSFVGLAAGRERRHSEAS
jgi:hypothetical protein